jgi:hypothetical protein
LINGVIPGCIQKISRRQGGDGADAVIDYAEEQTTKPSDLAFECDLVSGEYMGWYELWEVNFGNGFERV